MLLGTVFWIAVIVDALVEQIVLKVFSYKRLQVKLRILALTSVRLEYLGQPLGRDLVYKCHAIGVNAL